MGEAVDMERESGLAALGRTLRYLREKAGKSLGQLAEDTSYDKSYLCRLESGKRLSRMAVMEDLDRYYGTGDLLVQLWKVARYDGFKDKYKEFMRLESKAQVMHKYSPGVPGLLQTEEFAREALSQPQTTGAGDEAVEEQVAARMGRQLLLRGNPTPHVRFIIDEYAFRRTSTSTKTWDDQLLRIEAVALWPNVIVQILPFAAGLHGLMGKGSLTLLWQRDGSAVAYTEGDSSGVLMDDPEDVLRHRLTYDQLRDMALPPSESLTFIRGVLEDHRS
ncbi:helix-turn-helix domain-containing protein [Streptomyces sp. RY43-2]|uniref:Helix-turn-helix domain-containing protein n=1 Tax=Streptomyces macrolidinus TaxID=2952607 RepID=A0ABT0Z6U6_9ACTN|nr:helix-turn-helix transcriptional regulator [Streptomyces macrolidinus]MCN9239190.1 helix-turn-helix domain-containing protein [Streptomyces macrolidinus]